MTAVAIPYENLARLVASLWPQITFDHRDLSRDSADQLLAPLVFLLDALFKAENLHRHKNFLPFEGKTFFTGDPADLLGSAGTYLQTFATQVLPFSKTERQTFCFVMENLVDYFHHRAEPAGRDPKALFADHRFWIDNFAKILDGKIAAARIRFAPPAGVDGEWLLIGESITLPLAPFLTTRNDSIHFLISGVELEWLALDPWKGTQASVEPTFPDRLAEFLLANLQLGDWYRMASHHPTGAPHQEVAAGTGLAMTHFHRGEFGGCLAELERLPLDELGFPLLLLLRVKSLVALDRLAEGKRHLSTFLVLYPHYAEAYEIMGDITTREGQEELALNFFERAAAISAGRNLTEKIKKTREAVERNRTKVEGPKNEHFFDLTVESASLRPLVGRDREVRQMLEILISRTRRNVLLVGDRGTGKTALIRELARRILYQEVPSALCGKKVKEINFVTLLTGSKYRGQFEEKTLKLFSDFRQENSLLVLEDIHLMMSAGAARGTSLDLVNIIKPFLRDRSIQVIASTDYEEYKNSLEKDNALLGHFQRVLVGELSTSECRQVVGELATETASGEEPVIVPEPMIDEIVDNAKRSIRERRLPDSAILLLERCVAKARLREEDPQERRPIGENDILEALADFAHLPRSGFSLSFRERLARLKETMGRRIIGQNTAVERVADGVVTARLGLQVKKNRPSGSFLFVGPTGVGKTETALVLAEELFGSQDSLIRIDMSEYMERFTYSRFVGAAPGYVGYYDSNQLTDKVRQNPYSVILLDEIEKADSQLLNIFLQVLDAGRLTDARGNSVDFSKTTIVMTSNVGTSLFSRVTPGFAAQETIHVPRTAMVKALKRHFSPEFLNRIDDIVVFSHLSRQDMRRIVELQLGGVRNDLARQGKELVLSEAVADYLAKAGYSAEYGARNLMRTLQTELLQPIAFASLTADWPSGQQVIATLEGGQVVVSLDQAPLATAPSGQREHQQEQG